MKKTQHTKPITISECYYSYVYVKRTSCKHKTNWWRDEDLVQDLVPSLHLSTNLSNDTWLKKKRICRCPI